MPVCYYIDKSTRLIVITFQGVVTEQEIAADRERLAEDPEFNPAFSQLLDFRRVKQLHLSYSTVSKIAQSSIFHPGIKKAFLAPTDLTYGFSRMYELLSDQLNQQVQVFRQPSQALQWLGIAPDAITLEQND
ncbi:MAG: hypothetical protein AB1489_23375 [Acidobacteriota bacterium]